MKTHSIQKINKIRGISLLEVLITFATTMVFVAFTAPLSNDLAVRMRVTESTELLEEARRNLLQRCQLNRSAQISESLDGDSAQRVFRTDSHVDSITLTADCANHSASLTLYLFDTGAKLDPVLQFNSNSLAVNTRQWDCELISGDFRHAPEQCRPASAEPGI